MIRIKAHERVGDTVKEIEVSFEGEGFTTDHLAVLLDRLGYPSPMVDEYQQISVKIETGDNFVADNESWIPHTGGKCPVKRGTLVDVKYRDGEVILQLPANTLVSEYNRDASSCFWEDESCDCDIIAYRVCK